MIPHKGRTRIMTDKLNIYCFIGSLPSRAVIILTKVLDIPVQLNAVNILNGEQNSYWYKKINPTMKVPALADGYFTLSESRAILAYLVDTKMPGGCGLYPKDPKKRAKIDERLFFDAATFFPKVSSILQAYMQNKSDCDRKKTIQELMPVLKTMEEFLSETEYFAGNEMTIADISMFPTFTTVYDLGVDLSKFPKLISWCQKMQNIPGNDINQAGGKVLLEALGMKPKL
uniref:glutathione transferase n=1 Tax=Chironomus tentans TaxID=7153 RepID=C3V9V1_CHITE|nr:glutathione S-transferase [Chironomus tentans]